MKGKILRKKVSKENFKMANILTFFSESHKFVTQCNRQLKSTWIIKYLKYIKLLWVENKARYFKNYTMQILWYF